MEGVRRIKIIKADIIKGCDGLRVQYKISSEQRQLGVTGVSFVELRCRLPDDVLNTLMQNGWSKIAQHHHENIGLYAGHGAASDPELAAMVMVAPTPANDVVQGKYQQGVVGLYVPDVEKLVQLAKDLASKNPDLLVYDARSEQKPENWPENALFLHLPCIIWPHKAQENKTQENIAAKTQITYFLPSTGDKKALLADFGKVW